MILVVSTASGIILASLAACRASKCTSVKFCGVGGSGGYGLYQQLDIADIDDEYLVYPNYGIIVYDVINFTGSQKINYENTTNELSFVSSTSGNNNKGASCKLYYKGIEFTSY